MFQEIWFKEYQHYTKISTQKGIQYLLKALISFWGQDVKLKHITYSKYSNIYTKYARYG